ncbi:MAG: tannase/feruloyl esterase family alpha/beta hydrolase [Novosphingobium sp.]|nr:tannase/feruloyl esterase family alpha/beta hydrolase [Novosphingobium sp.]MCP5400873.1 tannase/feruloyl esterase family alpha/beta hydrolase [Novosphingobium sp.]
MVSIRRGMCLAALATASLPAVPAYAEGAAKAGLACDETLKSQFRPDAQTNVILVKQFRAGESIALDGDNPARSPKATNGVCLVKLVVGPGNPGPKDAPSTSRGIGIEIWLPSHDRWNKRIHAMGGGGFQGGRHASPEGIGSPYAYFIADREGAVSSTTDTGHGDEIVLGTAQPRGDFALNPDGSFASNLWEDFAVRAIHEQAVKTKALTEAFYGEPAKFAYWEGGSTGGRQGHKLAQAYPDDFDGIIANYPALNWNPFVAALLYPQFVIQRDLGGEPLSQAQLDLVSNAAIAACDVTGGQHVGFILDPSRCAYDPVRDRAVLCLSDGGTNDTPDCVTRKQATAINKMWYGPTRDGSVPDPAKDNGWIMPRAHGHLWYGLTRGTSLWNAYFTRAFGFPAGVANPGNTPTLGSDMIAIIAEEPSLADNGFVNESGKAQSGWKDLTYGEFAQLLEQAVAEDSEKFASINTDDPDLSEFRDRGGKMLFWHGLNDELIPPQGSVQYYEAVLAEMGGAEAVHEFYRLYLVPGAGHGSPNGSSNPGANPPQMGFQLYPLLVEWVENGKAPGAITLNTPSPGQPGAIGGIPLPPVAPDARQMSLPACPYPERISYVAGDPFQAGSYECR